MADFQAALEKAKAIAAKLAANQQAAHAAPPDHAAPPSADPTRGYGRVNVGPGPGPGGPPPPTSGYEHMDRQTAMQQSNRLAQLGFSGAFTTGKPGFNPADVGAGPGLGGGGPRPMGAVLSTLFIPTPLAGLVIGRGGENLRRIEQTYQVRVQIIPGPPGETERQTKISGNDQAAVDAAKEQILEIMERANKPPPGRGGPSSGGPDDRPPPFGRDRDRDGGDRGGRPPSGWGDRDRDRDRHASRATVQVPNNKVGMIIGHRGETVNALQEQSGARVNITPDSQTDRDANVRTITLVGTDEAIETAKRLIAELVNYQPTMRDDSMNPSHHHHHHNGPPPPSAGPMEMDPMRASRMTGGPPPPPSHGPGFMPPPPMPPSGRPGHGGLRHPPVPGLPPPPPMPMAMPPPPPGMPIPPPGVPPFVGMPMPGLPPPPMPPMSMPPIPMPPMPMPPREAPPHTETMHIPDERVGVVIGKGGETIKQIQSASHAKVMIDPQPDRDGQRQVTLVGTPESVEHARQLIMDKVSGRKTTNDFKYSQQQQQARQEEYNQAAILAQNELTQLGWHWDSARMTYTGPRGEVYDYSPLILAGFDFSPYYSRVTLDDDAKTK
ncbi:hypothetical protein CXG81DRAFT_19098 [Caulochytrium protostelioides]|uniref:K Homology domain-containing protein n=1 Tax=Caulochytrium protostelioides TaxID=1555241 RepID=A0A4P9X752_9FUNG|nr:hypothetical protein CAUPRSCDRAFT_10549 [Caulochytrium protostelioides]RKP01054.1 hypothetical protein CXG81DRAFT_19098 [Caulochytrium protostelioides]|eukprot:RKP01054.1 hypothetical protein CXG81DRAFT_19098 [Caulochytrium protostelioides]